MSRAAITLSVLPFASALAFASAARVAPAESARKPTGEIVDIPGGTFQMGSEAHHPEEGPVRTVTIGPFRIMATEVTNAEFHAFVEATGYVTMAEHGLAPTDHLGWPPELLLPGSMVFRMPAVVAGREDTMQWWSYVPGANWRAPKGPGSSIEGKDQMPVVQVAAEDAEAYATWVGGRLSTEAEWEFAARGGLDGADYAWGETYEPAQGWKANTWQGDFPIADDGADGFHGLAPVRSFPPNGYGLHDMAGNVWEHVADWFVPGHSSVAQTDPRGPPAELAARFSDPEIGPQRVIKGGSWLCRAGLLLPLPPGRTPGAGDRPRDQPHRLPRRLRRPERRAVSALRWTTRPRPPQLGAGPRRPRPAGPADRRRIYGRLPLQD